MEGRAPSRPIIHLSNIWDDTEVIPPISDPLSNFDIGRSSIAFATARRVSACHAEAFGVGGLNVC